MGCCFSSQDAPPAPKPAVTNGTGPPPKPV
jgi:serine/threonine protein kinase